MASTTRNRRIQLGRQECLKSDGQPISIAAGQAANHHAALGHIPGRLELQRDDRPRLQRGRAVRPKPVPRVVKHLQRLPFAKPIAGQSECRDNALHRPAILRASFEPKRRRGVDVVFSVRGCAGVGHWCAPTAAKGQLAPIVFGHINSPLHCSTRESTPPTDPTIRSTLDGTVHRYTSDHRG